MTHKCSFCNGDHYTGYCVVCGSDTRQNHRFANWLNEIDTRIDYDVRKQISLVEWRNLFDFAYSAKDACLMALTGRVR